jgi:hypothetical protein
MTCCLIEHLAFVGQPRKGVAGPDCFADATWKEKQAPTSTIFSENQANEKNKKPYLMSHEDLSTFSLVSSAVRGVCSCSCSMRSLTRHLGTSLS